jgi:endonuclease YncB( thermonuclease family)
MQDDWKQHGGATPYFSLNGKECWGRVVQLYDGDTMKVVIKLFDGHYKFNCRLNGIDTCEMKSKDPENKLKAIKARNRVLQLVNKAASVQLDKNYAKKEIDHIFESNVCLVWIKCGQFDKYGRLLCRIYETDKSDKSVGDILIEEKLAYAYDGGTKLTEAEQLDI